jgi:catechol 2,3-dioxygenase
MNLQTPLPEFSLNPNTRLGHVHYTVADLDNQINFYQQVLGFQLHWRDGDSAGMGAGEDDLLRMTQVATARRTHRTTGIYHFALLYPSKSELARAVARLFALKVPNSPTDHIFSKTTYLNDPEGNTIELYIRSLEDGNVSFENGQYVIRRKDGVLSDGREPLDLDDLFKALSPDVNLADPLPRGSQIGHVHLYASSLDQPYVFYHDILGFLKGPLMRDFRMGEVALSDEKNHVIAFNNWQGEGAPPPPPNMLGLRYFSIIFTDQTQLDTVLARLSQAEITVEKTEQGYLVQDPSQISVMLSSA